MIEKLRRFLNNEDEQGFDFGAVNHVERIAAIFESGGALTSTEARLAATDLGQNIAVMKRRMELDPDERYCRLDDLLIFLYDITQFVNSPICRGLLQDAYKQFVLDRLKWSHPYAFQDMPRFADRRENEPAYVFFEKVYKDAKEHVYIELLEKHDRELVEALRTEKGARPIDYYLRSREHYETDMDCAVGAVFGIAAEKASIFSAQLATALSVRGGTWAARVASEATPQSKAVPPLPEKAPALWSEDKQPGDTPPDFIKRHYGPWVKADLSGITRPDIKRLDSSLYMALANWLRKHELPSDLSLPTLKEANDAAISNMLSGTGKYEGAAQLHRLAAAYRRREIQ